MTSRIPIQIALSPSVGEDCPDILFALCNDGSIWRVIIDNEERWERIRAVPDELADQAQRDGIG